MTTISVLSKVDASGDSVGSKFPTANPYILHALILAGYRIVNSGELIENESDLPEEVRTEIAAARANAVLEIRAAVQRISVILQGLSPKDRSILSAEIQAFCRLD